MRRTWLVFALMTVVVAGCGGSAASGGVQATTTQAAATQSAATPAPAAATPATAATGSPAAGAGSAVVACTLITAEEAAAALGQAVDAGVAPVPGENTCVFSGPVLSLTSVQIRINDPAEFTPTQASVPGSFTVTPASGIGEAAYYKKLELPNSGGEFLMELSVHKGQVYFTITVLDHTASANTLMEAEKTLALAAVDRI